MSFLKTRQSAQEETHQMRKVRLTSLGGTAKTAERLLSSFLYQIEKLDESLETMTHQVGSLKPVFKFCSSQLHGKKFFSVDEEETDPVITAPSPEKDHTQRPILCIGSAALTSNSELLHSLEAK